MKKTLLVTQFFPPQVGGAQLYFYELTRRLPADKIYVLAHRPLRPISAEADGQIQNVIYRSFFHRLKHIWPKWLPLIWHTFYLTFKIRPQMLWAGEVLPTGLVVWFVSKLTGLPYIVSAHGADLLNLTSQPGLAGRRRRRLAQLVLARARHSTVNSEFTRLQISKLGIRRHKSVIIYPCPVISVARHGQTKELANSVSGKLNIDDELVILTVSRLVPRKGTDILLRSLMYLGKYQSKVKLVVVGSGPRSAYLEASTCALGLQRQVIFLGQVNATALKYLYGLADIFAMVPRVTVGLVEGFGIVYLEAGSFGLPVIGSAIGGVPEAVIDFYDENHDTATGLLVQNPENPKEVAKKILLLINDPGLRKKMGQNGRQRSEKFKWEQQVVKLSQILN